MTIERRLHGKRTLWDVALLARGLAWAGFGVLRLAVASVRGKAARVHALRSLLYGAGLVSGVFGGRLEEYARE